MLLSPFGFIPGIITIILGLAVFPFNLPPMNLILIALGFF